MQLQTGALFGFSIQPTSILPLPTDRGKDEGTQRKYTQGFGVILQTWAGLLYRGAKRALALMKLGPPIRTASGEVAHYPSSASIFPGNLIYFTG